MLVEEPDILFCIPINGAFDGGDNGTRIAALANWCADSSNRYTVADLRPLTQVATLLFMQLLDRRTSGPRRNHRSEETSRKRSRCPCIDRSNCERHAMAKEIDKTLNDLFHGTLKDIYFAEKKNPERA